jgi:triacylglycerol lipase
VKVILAHGPLGFGAIDILNQHVTYFKGVAEDLTRLGIKVRTPFINPYGPVSERANALATAIRDFFSPTERGYVIAHGLGGLDARFALAQIAGVAARVKSLVTIGTPHLGSPIADLHSSAKALHSLFGIDPVILREVESSGALGDLTTDAAKKFAAANPDRNDVLYRNIVGTGRQGTPPALPLFHTCAAFSGTFALMAARRLVSDGMVSFDSARRNKTPWEVWKVDHAEEVGWDLDDPLAAPSPEHLARYRRIVRRLRARIST